MAGSGSAQSRLNRIVHVIAQNMVAEVCSIYLTRAGDVLELFATEGLKSEAVHLTRLRIGEGLVGSVAERGLPLNLSEAPSHPRFVYRPETGEDIYHSFLGVPILRGGRVVGVLVVQNVASRHYAVEEIEVLQTIAMVLSELVGSGDIVNLDEFAEGASDISDSRKLEGKRLVDGVSAGIAVFHTPQAKITKTVSDNVDEERTRLENAMATMRMQLESMMDHPDLELSPEQREILDTYRMFAYDQGWQDKMRDAVQSGLTAEAAVDRVQQENRARMSKIRDPYLRERVSDFEDLANRLIRIIQGDLDGGHAQLTEESILIARALGPAEIMDYDRALLKGIVLEEGSTTSHVTIIARAMGIPVLGQVSGLLDHVETGQFVIVDTEGEHVYLRPSDDIVDSYKDIIKIREQRAAEYKAARDLPAQTLDGQRVSLFMNAGLLVDLPSLDSTGAEGIGLFRTEFQFMVSSKLPKVADQLAIYNAALDAADNKPVIFRTLDIGGDKQVAFLPRDDSENPAMGWRAIRIALDRPVLLRYQLRALLYAAAGRDLNVMFPMIAEVAEFRQCKKLLDKELKRLDMLGKEKPRSIKVGVMLEVPSLSWQLDILLGEIDFMSIGTNDLMQFFFACDRGNPRLEDRYDLLAPPVLAFLNMIIRSCDEAGVPVTVCGEMGGRPLEAMALVALGLKRLSISPSAIGPVKRMLRSVDLAKLRQFLMENITSPEHSIRESLLHFARDHDIKL